MLRLLITCDASQETSVIEAILSLTAHKFYKFIEEVDYGNSLQYLAIFFICRDSETQSKSPIHFTKVDQTLCLDITLNYYQFIIMTHEQRLSELCTNLLLGIPLTIKKYEITDFDLDKLVSKFSQWFNEHNFIIDISGVHKVKL